MPLRRWGVSRRHCHFPEPLSGPLQFRRPRLERRREPGGCTRPGGREAFPAAPGARDLKLRAARRRCRPGITP